jgi:hypothetical protein
MSNQKFGEKPGRGKESQAGVNRGKSGSGSVFGERTGTTSTVAEQVQDALDQQVTRGARVITNIAHSAKRAADELETDAPQIADLVRGMAARVEEYSRNLEDQSISEIYQAASHFTRRQPAPVFGAAALAGFFMLRALRSSQTNSSSGTRTSGSRRGDFHGS